MEETEETMATEVVKHLIKARASTSIRTSGGDPPLGIAAQQGHTPVVRLLLDAKAEVDARDGNTFGDTALRQAAGWGQLEAASVLLVAGADLSPARAA